MLVQCSVSDWSSKGCYVDCLPVAVERFWRLKPSVATWFVDLIGWIDAVARTISVGFDSWFELEDVSSMMSIGSSQDLGETASHWIHSESIHRRNDIGVNRRPLTATNKKCSTELMKQCQWSYSAVSVPLQGSSRATGKGISRWLHESINRPFLTENSLQRNTRKGPIMKLWFAVRNLYDWLDDGATRVQLLPTVGSCLGDSVLDFSQLIGSQLQHLRNTPQRANENSSAISSNK